MKPNTALIDQAVIGTLLDDATLRSLLPDGVYRGVAAPNAQRFVVVDVIDAVDTSVFGGRAIEEKLYRVKAVTLNSSGGDANAGAARIDALLEDQPLTIAGFSWMETVREGTIEAVETDEKDTAIRWQHRGGMYRVKASILGM